MQEREDFVKVLEIEDFELRTHPKHYTTRGHTINEGIFFK